ncbi:MAG: hypothetical protein ACRELX_15715, partial [Longimicrobiales bacterium]
MNPKLIRLLFIGAGVGLGAVLAFVVVPVVLAAVAGGIIGGIVGGFLAGRLAREPRPRETAAVRRDENVVVTLFESLVAVNITARTTPFPLDVTAAVEGVIDGLRRTLPEANGEYGSNALTWDLNQAARDYLPRVTSRYAALSPAQREERKSAALATLTGLADAVQRAEQAVHSRKDDEFAVASKFL